MKILYFYVTQENAPAGFYVAPYFKYASHFINWTATFDYINPTRRDETASVDFKFNEFGGGVQLGYQWVLGSGFSIDWYFLGPRVSKFNMIFSMKGSASDLEAYKDAEQEIGDVFKGIPIIGSNVSSSHTANSVEVKAPFVFPNLRTGIAIGFAF